MVLGCLGIGTRVGTLPHPLLACLLAALLAWTPGAHAAGAVPVGSGVPQGTRAEAFDAILQRVTGPESLDSTRIAYNADLERLRSLLPANDRARDVRFRSVYCGNSDRWKDPAAGLAYSDRALAMARAGRDLASEARARLCRAAYVMYTKGTQRGLPELEQAIALLQDAGEPQLLAEAVEMRGDLHSLLGEQAKAMLDFQRARAGYRDAGIRQEVEPLMLSVAVAYRRMGDYPQAQRYFSQALGRMRDKGDWEGVGTNLIQLGFLHGETGAPDKARAVFTEALELAAKHDDRNSLNASRLGLAEAQIALGQPAQALDTLKLARAGFAAEQDGSSNDMLLLMTGRALAGQDKHAEALEQYRQAMPLMERDGNHRYLAMLFKARATSQEALGLSAAALRDYKRFNELQLELQGKMRLEQSRLLQYEYEIRRRDFDNRKLRADAQTRQLRVEALERMRRWQTLALALGLVLMAVLATLATRQWYRSRRLRELAMVDPLTGAASRLRIDTRAFNAIAHASRDGTPMVMLLLDLDHFKDINDRYGHAAGDKVLRATVAAWQDQLRKHEPLGRIGGEEFMVVCPDTALEQGVVVAHRLCEATRALRFPDIAPDLRVTVSIGLAQARSAGETRDALFDRADAALYRAKQPGRDRVEA